MRTTPLLLVLVAGCWKHAGSEGGGQISDERARAARRPAAHDVDVPPGYRIDLIARGLTFPTGVAFGDDGAIYVTESGYSYGEVTTKARVVEIDPARGAIAREIATGEHAPWNGLDASGGAIFVAQGGAVDGGRVVRIDLASGEETVLADGLPSLGDHHTNGPLVHDGFVYFMQGVATNSGVVGEDNHAFGWLARQPEFHDVPCEDVTLAGVDFTSADPFGGDGEVVTGAFLPFGTASEEGQVVKGAVPCSGALMRVPASGGDVELVAWGFRNPYGLARGEDGTLWLTDNGYDERGSRPVYGSADWLWRVEPGRWYGWPDFEGGRPLTMGAYDEGGGEPRGFVLAEHPGRPPEPAARLPVHASADGLDLSRSDRFGHRGQAFVALFGDMAPGVGKVMAPVGFTVVRVDLETGVVEDFARNAGYERGPASRIGGRGLERPIAVRFDPSGEALYVVDFGVLRMTDRGPEPQPGTGTLWRITRDQEVTDAR